MRKQRWRIALAVVALAAMVAARAGAEVVTEQSASILVFPKVIADGTRDTIIQISNTSNSMVYAHCFYVNATINCTEVDFDIVLTKQQPTYWLVSEGRLVDPMDPVCSRITGVDACPNAGIDPGRVPPVVEDFQGELKCVEVDASGAPLSGNHLKGEATLVTYDVCNPTTSQCELSGFPCNPTVPDSTCDGERFDVAKYNALGIIGNDQNDGDGVLCLGGVASDACPKGAEYNACPQTWILDHMADGAASPALGSESNVTTDITVVPCTENFETQVPTSVTIQFAITNEYEQPFSASTTVQCWAEMQLSSINEVFSRGSIGSDFAQTRMRPSAGTASGFLVVSDERYAGLVPVGANAATTLQTATAASNLQVEGERIGPDLIVIPGEQLPSD
jgi:hypothetical protein